MAYSHFTGEENFYPIGNNHLAFMYGLGMNYYLTPKLMIDLSWLHYDGVAQLSKINPGGVSFIHYQPNAELYLLGVSYKFGDLQSLAGIENDLNLEEDLYLSGFYLGVQGGYADSGWGNLSGFADPNYFLTVSGDNGPGVRFYAGYDFTEHWGIEAGYTYVVNSAAPGVNDSSFLFHQIAAIKTQGIDLVGKGRWPLVEGLALYAKAGVGYLQATGLRHSDRTLPQAQDPIFAKDKFTHVAPVYGIGMSYDLTEHATIDISGTRYVGNPSLGRTPVATPFGPQFIDYQPNLNILMLGLQYKI
jgi:opacity protein-like surface antigen